MNNTNVSIQSEQKTFMVKVNPLTLFSRVSRRGSQLSLKFSDILDQSSWTLTLKYRKMASDMQAVLETSAEEWPLMLNAAPGEYRVSIVKSASSGTREWPLNMTLSVRQENLLPREKTSIVVIGSCVSRDNFNSKISSKWKDYYELTGEHYQMSLISLFSKKVSYPFGAFDDLDSFSSRVTKSDFEKELIGKMAASPPDLLIVDLRADLRFGLIDCGGSFVTNNPWKLGKSRYYSDLADQPRLSLLEQRQEYLQAFEETLAKFQTFREQFIPDTKIILNTAKAVEFSNTNGELSAIDSEFGKNTNDLWKVLDNEFKKLPNVDIINAWTPDLTSSSIHAWGPGPVHFEQKYYERFSRQLRHLSGDRLRFSIGMG